MPPPISQIMFTLSLFPFTYAHGDSNVLRPT